MSKTFGNYVVRFEGHTPVTVYSSSFKDAVETAIDHINIWVAPYTGEELVSVHQLELVYLP